MQGQEIQSVIERIRQMERCYNEVLRALEVNANEMHQNSAISKMIQELTAYMDSGLWLQDYECDERGELPSDLQRGVLSEDGLYNLLITVHTSV